MNEANYISEDLLQKLLADYPNLISGSQIHPERPRRWLLVAREFQVPDSESASGRWSLDHLFIDQDGIPTLVEAKRSTDTRIRREVIGQILDYAANAISYWSLAEIKLRFEESCKHRGEQPEEKLNIFLERITDSSTFWESVETNLKAGKIRMLIVADAIPKELQRIIEFLNGQMNPAEILGVEIKQFVDQTNQGVKTLVPRVVGQTANAQTVKSRLAIRAENWNEATFFAKTEEQCGIKVVEISRKILNWSKHHVTRIYFGKGHQMGSFSPVLDTANGSRWCFAVWTNGSIEIHFQHMANQPPFNLEKNRRDFLYKLNSIKGVNISDTKLNKRPSFPLAILHDDAELTKFFDVCAWYWSMQNSSDL